MQPQQKIGGGPATRWGTALLSGLALLLSAGCAAGQTGKVDAMSMVKEHNVWRAEVGVPPLRWSKKLEKRAEQWAATLEKEGCVMRHSPAGSGVGENLYWASGKRTATRRDASGNWLWKNSRQQITAKEVVAAWGGEKKWYSHRHNSCKAPRGQSCGHYTQMVWRTTSELGCAQAICGDQSQVWVCNYAPAGNIVGRKPY